MFIVYYLYCFLLYFYVRPLNCTVSEICPCSSPNVRTVLFKNVDIFKQCWNEEEIALLYARRLFQMAIPKRVPMNMPLLIRYIKICLSTVKTLATSKRAHYLMMSAMADTFGGYLQAFAVPLANAEYYEGSNSYSTTKQINELLLAFKNILNTDGGGWTKPIYIKRSKEIIPYVVPSPLRNNFCSNLLSNYDIPSCNKDENKKIENTKIPLPFVDDSKNPSAVVVPFKDRGLYSLFAKNSSDVLIRYYKAVIHCLMQPEDFGKEFKCMKSTEMYRFNKDFHRWLVKVVMPHLHDDKWYAGFGGVLTLLESLSLQGFPTPVENVNDPNTLTVWKKPCIGSGHSGFYVFCVCAFLLLFWLVAFIIYCCHINRYRGDPSISKRPSESNATILNSLFLIYRRHCEGNEQGVKPTNPSGEKRTIPVGYSESANSLRLACAVSSSSAMNP